MNLYVSYLCAAFACGFAISSFLLEHRARKRLAKGQSISAFTSVFGALACAVAIATTAVHLLDSRHFGPYAAQPSGAVEAGRTCAQEAKAD
jgi:acetylornithine/succinyldiaminopimelate/putrescine aminotransferase